MAKQSGERLHHVLPDLLDHEALGALAAFLKSNRGHPVVLDGTALERVGALAAQIITLGAMTWAKDAVAFAVLDPSEKIAADFSTLGLSQQWAEISQPQGA